jgi:hypothetical protein
VRAVLLFASHVARRPPNLFERSRGFAIWASGLGSLTMVNDPNVQLPFGYVAIQKTLLTACAHREWTLRRPSLQRLLFCLSRSCWGSERNCRSRTCRH